MAKRYYWLKLKEDFFNSKRIKKLRKIAGGDTFVIIYLKMQLLSLTTNGVITFTGLEEDFASELALDLDEDIDNVRLTLSYLSNVGLIETSDDINFFLPYVLETTGSECSSAKRVREFRAKQKLLQSNDDVTGVKQIVNGEIEKEIEKENRERVDFNSIVDAYHQHCPSFSRVRNLSDARKKAIKARLKTYSEEDLIEAFDKAEASTFLKGGNDRNWTADFDWILKDANLAKILDGKYDNTFQKDKKETNSDAWSIAWEQVQMLIRRYGRTNSAKAYAEMDEITAATVKRLGYINLCNSENIVSERANFRNIYEGIQNGK